MPDASRRAGELVVARRRPAADPRRGPDGDLALRRRRGAGRDRAGRPRRARPTTSRPRASARPSARCRSNRVVVEIRPAPDRADRRQPPRQRAASTPPARRSRSASSWAVTGPQRSVAVADRGPGIPPDRLAAVFDRFYKADPSRHGGSSGLGLAIAAEHATLLGRRARRASNREGGGLRDRAAPACDTTVTRRRSDREGRRRRSEADDHCQGAQPMNRHALRRATLVATVLSLVLVERRLHLERLARDRPAARAHARAVARLERSRTSPRRRPASRPATDEPSVRPRREPPTPAPSGHARSSGRTSSSTARPAARVSFRTSSPSRRRRRSPPRR